MTRLSLIPAAFLAMCSPAHAQSPVCGPVIETLSGFAAKYGETPVFSGLSAGGYVITVIVNPETGTFSAFRITTDGVACIVDMGEGARLSAPVAPGEPS